MDPEIRKILDDVARKSHDRGILGPSQFTQACRCPVCRPDLHKEN